MLGGELKIKVGLVGREKRVERKIKFKIRFSIVNWCGKWIFFDLILHNRKIDNPLTSLSLSYVAQFSSRLSMSISHLQFSFCFFRSQNKKKRKKYCEFHELIFLLKEEKAKKKKQIEAVKKGNFEGKQINEDLRHGPLVMKIKSFKRNFSFFNFKLCLSKLKE